MKKSTRSIAFGVVTFAAVAALGVGAFFLHNAPSHANPADDTIGMARFDEGSQLALNNAAKQADLASKLSRADYSTIPAWQSSFDYNGQTYPYQMVGKDPQQGGTTHVRTVLIPIDLTFDCSGVTRSGGRPVGGLPGGCATSGEQLTGSSNVNGTLNSPIFSDATYSQTGDTTQYGDEIQRANFWTVEKQNYHVILDQPTVLPTLSWTVPNTQGFESTSPTTGIHRGFISIDWWYSQVANQLTALNLSPETFPIFLTHDTVLWDSGDPASCCIIGYHDAIPMAQDNGKTAIYTYAWASWTTNGFFAPSTGIADVNALSHEVAEWLNDPFTDNGVPNWYVPQEPQYPCSNILEVGDPVVGVSFTQTVNGYTYHLQDEVFFSFFARQTPSIGINGQYTYLGTFNTPAGNC